MKLTELVNTVGSRFREASNVVRYPVENISRLVINRFNEEYQKIDVPFTNNNRDQKDVHATGTANSAPTGNNSTSVTVQTPNYHSEATVHPTPTRQTTAKSTQHNFTPPLKKNEDIRGRRGRYRISSDEYIQVSERVRIYYATHVLNNKAVLIKEYLLPEGDFNSKEARERKEQFELNTSINLKSGTGQDFRLVTPLDAIAPLNEKRCYLIIEPITNSITLKEHLETQAHPMSAMQVRHLIGQVLQTLWFVHNQRIRLPNGEVRLGLPHGNLNLDSLLIVNRQQQNILNHQNFFVYLSDFSLWEDIFKPPASKIAVPSVDKDLKDLGYLCFHLLLGKTHDPIYGHPLDPKNEQHWAGIDDIALKRLICRLIGLDTPFNSADEARQALFTLPTEIQAAPPLTEVADDKVHELEKAKPLKLIVSVFGLIFGFAGVVTWQLLSSVTTGKTPEPVLSSQTSNTCCIAKSKNVPSGIFTYTSSTSEGTWNYLMTKPGLITARKNIGQELNARGMKLQIQYKPKPSPDLAIQTVQAQKADFLVLNTVGDISARLKQANFKLQPVAYEGIAVFIAFSDGKRAGSLPEALQGKINFEQLRKLYSGEITNWNQLGSNLPDLPVKLYMPLEKDVISAFKEVVFKNQPQQKQRFEELIAQGKIVKQDTSKSLGNILADFETGDRSNKKGGIGFGLLRKVYGQCSVYPLSVGEQGQEIQSLVQIDGSDINPTIDLCNDKGSYYPNVDVFTSNRYPLAYSMAIAYPDNTLAGASFAETLKTDEAQIIFRELGLVPIRKFNNL